MGKNTGKPVITIRTEFSMWGLSKAEHEAVRLAVLPAFPLRATVSKRAERGTTHTVVTVRGCTIDRKKVFEVIQGAF